MQEFSSITASAYDAESLAPLLTEKSAEGWAVVSIVAAGTKIVAYLSRDNADSGSAGGEAADVSAVGSPVDEMPAAEGVDASSNDSAAASEVTDVGNEPADAAAAVDTPTLPDDDAPYAPADSSTSTEPAAAPAAAAEPAGEAAEPSVPAGWYADPSGRYELRYWDGSAWTEHVSRAGQQFTDPPVA